MHDVAGPADISLEADVSRSSSPAEVQFAAVDFSLLQRSTLDRLAGHYAVELPPDASDRSVAGLVGREFSRQHVRCHFCL